MVNPRAKLSVCKQTKNSVVFPPPLKTSTFLNSSENGKIDIKVFEPKTLSDLEPNVNVSKLIQMNQHNLKLLKNDHIGSTINLIEKKDLLKLKRNLQSNMIQPDILNRPTKLSSNKSLFDSATMPDSFSSNENKNASIFDRRIDPNFQNVCHEVLKKFLLKVVGTGGAPREVLLQRIYKNPSILLIKRLFSSEECSSLRDAIQKNFQWIEKMYTYPSHIYVCHQTSPFKEFLSRIVKIAGLPNELKIEAIVERIPGTDEYSHRRSPAHVSSAPKTAHFWDKSGEHYTVIVFLNDDGGNMDFYKLGFCAQPIEGSVLILDHSTNKTEDLFDWHELKNGNTTATRIVLFYRFKEC